MNDTIWEEKNLIDQLKNLSEKEENDKCDTTINTETKLNKKILIDITSQKKRGIYKILNKIDGKFYLGSSKDIEHRWADHIRELRKNNHHNDYLQHSWNKYGESSFDFIIIEQTNDNLLLIEQKYLDDLKKQQDKCYNLNFDAKGGDISDYSRKKISLANIGRKASDELRKKLSDVHKGIKLSESAKLKLKLFNKGKKLSNEHKLKIGISNKGKKYSLDVRKRMRESRIGTNLGNKNPSYDTTIYNFYNKISNISRKCTCYELYTEFQLKNIGISKLKHGKIKSYKGWIILENKD